MNKEKRLVPITGFIYNLPEARKKKIEAMDSGKYTRVKIRCCGKEYMKNADPPDWYERWTVVAG